MAGIDVLKQPLHEQRLHYANQRIEALKAFAATVMPPPTPVGAMAVHYVHETLGSLTAHYKPDPEDPQVLAVYLFSRDIINRLTECELGHIALSCAMTYERACAESNLDFQIERKYG
jgi:hypothetical protein